MKDIDFDIVPATSILIYEKRLRENLELLARIGKEADVSVLSSLKAFALPRASELINDHLNGYNASSLNEVRIGAEFNEGHVHACFPVYSAQEMGEVAEKCSHITFNTVSQWESFAEQMGTSGAKSAIRLNPGYSEINEAIYDPASESSRLGEKIESWTSLPKGVTGLHIHATCENDAQVFANLWEHLKTNHLEKLQEAEWINFGGGLLITRRDFDVDLFISTLKDIKASVDAEIFLEPGSAVVYEAGYLVAEVLDVVEHQTPAVAMLSTSFTCHMPDCLEMPYKPFIVGAIQPNDFFPTYKMGGCTCLAGDEIGDYSFVKALSVGDKVVFFDMARYSFVKTNMFNGVEIPKLAWWNETNELEMLFEPSYGDFRSRLG